jgi:hypothetical protein
MSSPIAVDRSAKAFRVRAAASDTEQLLGLRVLSGGGREQISRLLVVVVTARPTGESFVSFRVGDDVAVEVDQRRIECFEDVQQPSPRVHACRESHARLMPTDPITKPREGVTGVAPRCRLLPRGTPIPAHPPGVIHFVTQGAQKGLLPVTWMVDDSRVHAATVGRHSPPAPHQQRTIPPVVGRYSDLATSLMARMALSARGNPMYGRQ